MMSHTMPCCCQSGLSLMACCGALHLGQPAPTAEALMRSRYSAYVLGQIDYLVHTTLPCQQAGLNVAAMRDWSSQSQWLGLSVLDTQAGHTARHAWVTFEARWADADGVQVHHERSAFVRPASHWFFIDPMLPVRAGRNDPCPCFSGVKFKKCCAPMVDAYAAAHAAVGR